MAQKDLIPLNKRTKEEQKRIASNGGKASVIARRKRKSLKESLLLLLEDEKIQESVIKALLKESLKGNVKAFEVIRDTIGEKPIEKVMMSEVSQETIEELEQIVKEK